MSEPHWAIRASVYHADEIVTEDESEFVMKELSELQELVDEEQYDVDIEVDKDEIERHIDDARSRAEEEIRRGAVAVWESEGFIDWSR